MLKPEKTLSQPQMLKNDFPSGLIIPHHPTHTPPPAPGDATRGSHACAIQIKAPPFEDLFGW